MISKGAFCYVLSQSESRAPAYMLVVNKSKLGLGWGTYVRKVWLSKPESQGP